MSLNLVDRVIRKLKSAAFAAQISFPKKVECNICGWTGRHFDSDNWHPYTICWKCRSEIRHRLLAAALQKNQSLSMEKLIRGKDVLHFAPETVLAKLIRKSSASYVTANVDDSADLKLDITNMKQLKEEKYDTVVACDVLEHVSNDHLALQEIFRILRPQGYAILTVPQKDGLADTYEDSTITDPADRERVFGQSDHLRIYGANFSEIVQAAGFQVTVIDEKSFEESMVLKNVLFPPILSTHPLATNYRKVFFAMKPE